MVIDAHVHLGRGSTIKAYPVDLLKSMDEAGIDKALVFAGKLNDYTTEDAIQDCLAAPDRLFAVGSYSNNLTFEALNRVESYFDKGVLRGLKFYPGYEYFYPADSWLRSLLGLCAKYKRPAIFHSGDTYSKVHAAKLKYAHPLHIDDLAVEMPDLKIIVAHFGYPWELDAAEVVYKNPNVYVDCSGFVYGDFDVRTVANYKTVWDRYLEVAGTLERVLFGTDWPISNQKPYVETVQEILRGYPEKDKILFENAKGLFGL